MQDAWILLVEDNADHQALALRALRKLNPAIPVVVAHDGGAAMEALYGPRPKALARVPALVLLDLKLAHTSGFDVLNRLRSAPLTAGVPVVVLTSSDEERDLEISYCLGANNYIQKPVDYERFIHVIREAGDFWLSPLGT